MIRLWHLVVDLWHGDQAPELYIDERRINDEVRRERRAGLDDDVEYRARVKRRMVEGLTSKELPSLYNRPEVLKRRSNVATFPRK